MWSALLTAFRTLTILPLPGTDTPRLSRTLPFFPLAGAFLGLLVLLFGRAALSGFGSPAVLAVLALALVVFLTGGLHLDGLGDVADAFGGGRSRERVLEILKDTRMGSFGVAAIAFDLLLRAAGWQHCLEQGEPTVIFWSLVFGRSAQALALVCFPNARPDSIAAPFGRAKPADRALGIGTFLITAAAAACLTGPLQALLYAGCAAAVTLAFGLYCRRRIGGITGDCLGATNELAEIAVLLAGIA